LIKTYTIIVNSGMPKENMHYVSKKNIQEFWTKNVPGFDVISKDYSPEQKEFYLAVDKHRYKYDSYILPLLESFVKEGDNVLEIGCGLGSDSRQIARKGGSIISLDLSFNNACLTKKGAKLLGLDKNRAVCGDAENLPFKDNAFDAVYSFGVLHHTPNTKKAIDEIYRIIKPNGKCLVMLYHKGYAYYLLLLIYIPLFVKGKLRGNLDVFTSKYDHTPLSKMYSKKETRALFRKFRNLGIEMTTYGGVQNHRVLRYIYTLLNKSHFLMNRFGSFLLIKGKK